MMMTMNKNGLSFLNMKSEPADSFDSLYSFYSFYSSFWLFIFGNFAKNGMECKSFMRRLANNQSRRILVRYTVSVSVIY